MSQPELANRAEMKQPRISLMEQPGATKFSLETLVRLAAAFKVGLQVRFVPFSEMLEWENEYSQDAFTVTKLEDDTGFIKPSSQGHTRPVRRKKRVRSEWRRFQMPGGQSLQAQFTFEQTPGVSKPNEVIQISSKGGSVLNQNILSSAAGGVKVYVT
jgi:hypothetical protein